MIYRFLIIYLVSVFFLQNERSIAWEDSLQLKWEDFKGAPTYGTTVAAVTASGITFGFSSKMSETELVDYSVYVDAHFYPDKSWFIEGRADASILDHERLHFDITELHARKFKQRIAQTKFTISINSEMDYIHSSINNELTLMQKKYDRETNHSQNVQKQMEWQKYIKLELGKLNYYK